MSVTWHDPRPRADVPAWRVIAALIASALLIAYAGQGQEHDTSTSPDPLTFPANHHQGDSQP